MMDFVKNDQLELVSQGFSVGPSAGVGGHGDGLQLFFLSIPDANGHIERIFQAGIPLV